MLAILAAILVAAGPSAPNSSAAPLTTVAPVPSVLPLQQPGAPSTGGPVPEQIERGSNAGPVSATPFSAGPNQTPSAGPTTGTRTPPTGGPQTPNLSR